MIQQTFTATLEKSPNKGGWTYVVWPESAKYFGTKGAVKVRAKADGVEFTSSFMAMGNDTQMLPIKSEVRKIIGKVAGDSVTIELLERL